MTNNTNTTAAASGRRRIKVRAIERDEPDLRRLARALIDLAIEQSQREAPETTGDGTTTAASTPTTTRLVVDIASDTTNADPNHDEQRRAA